MAEVWEYVDIPVEVPVAVVELAVSIVAVSVSVVLEEETTSYLVSKQERWLYRSSLVQP